MPHSRSDELLIARLFDVPAKERAVFWHRACVDDPTLRSRHPAFARLFPAPGSESISSPIALSPSPFSPDGMLSLFTSALDAVDHEAPGVRIDHYKLLQKIGEGGFGSVWMAEQLEPIRRRVALKILKIGMDTKEVIARFEAERQALALMDHPNIARVFDAGATAAGRPFFVMELVRGVAITRYCDDNRLTAEARLRLFISVCQAVQHAHQKGIIHRDLKPSNILVTLHDGTPVPKVIDFGIAKATDKQLTEKTLVTHFHAFVGTPAYTSPEQMEMSGLDVDTRSDIYSLGVLLYELLAGRPPFDPDALLKSGLEAMRRTIRETDPPRPSHRLGTLTDADRTSVAHARGTDAANLSLLLRGDVDWIVMHCLEKDRTRRYETANALARDVQRHLASEPVAARPPSTLYRAQKLFRRHRLAVIATAAVAASLVGGLIVSSTLFVSERAARQRAVAAEKSEEKLRQQAEAARTDEARRASRTSLALAEQLFQEAGRAAEGVAHLVRAAHSDPANTAIGPRLISALAFRSFAEPVGNALVHPAPVVQVFYASDSHHGLTIAEDGRLRYWDLDRGSLLRTMDEKDVNFFFYKGSVSDLSPDRKRCAIGGVNGSVSIWELELGRRVVGSLRLEQKITAVQFSPDGRRLASCSDDRTVRIWNAATGELETTLRHDYMTRTAAFSPDGTRLVTTTGGGPSLIWDLRIENSLPLKILGTGTVSAGGGGAVTGGCFSPDGRLVVITDQRGALLYDAATGAAVGARLLQSAPAYSVVFARDGQKIVTASDDGDARLWALPSGKPLLKPLPHGGRALDPHLTPNERFLVTGSFDGIARVWDLTTGEIAMEPIRVGDIRSIDLSPDGTEFMTGGRDGVVRRWGLAPGGARPFHLAGDPDRIPPQPHVSKSGILTALYRDRLQQIDLLTGDAVGAPRLFPTSIRGGTLAPDRRHLVVRTDSGEVETWDLQGAEIVRRPLRGHGLLGFATFSADSSYWVQSDSSNTARAWRLDRGALVAGPIENVAKGISFSPDSRRLALGMADNSVAIWDLPTGHRSGEALRHRSPIAMVQFSPDGRLIATASQDGARLWDAATNQPVGAPLPHRNFVRGVAFTRDGRRLLTWTPLETRLWDVATRAPLTEPMIGGIDISGATISDDGARVATWARANREVRLWDSHSGQLLAEPIQVPDASPAIVFDPAFVLSGRFLSMPIAQSGRVVWPVPPPSSAAPDWLLRLATAMAGGEIDARAVFREQAVEASAFDAIRHELAKLPADAPYVEWGRWILADRNTRPIAPGFTITPAAVAKFGGPETSDEPTPNEP